MTSKESLSSMGGSFQWVKNVFGYKVPLMIVSVLLLVVIWESPPPSLISYTGLSTSQIQSFLSMPGSDEYITNTSSESTPTVVPTVHTESPGAEENTEPKNRPVETVTPEFRQSASPLNETTISPTNASADVLAEEDTQLVEEPLILDVADPVQHRADEKYIIPLLSYQVGTGNQLMEYKSAATVARTLNRTLCLIPFYGGPPRHLGYLGDRHSGLIMEDRYDTEILSKYVQVISMDECVKRCEGRLDVHWRLRSSRPPHWDRWFNNTPRFSFDFTKQTSSWSSTADVADAMGRRNNAKCVGLGGLFPGLRWRGVMYAASTYMQHSKRIMKAADLLQNRALGSNDPNYISVHWRFEESNCRGHPLGLCFSRCNDGAVIANGRASETWNNMTLEGRKVNSKNGFNGVFMGKEDLSEAIYDRAVKHGMQNVYLSTDGWLRGKESAGILKWVVEDLRNKGLNVAGLWMVEGLPNFADDFYVHSAAMPVLFGVDEREIVSNHMIALVEQEICLRSSVFLGSGQSSWSLAVADTRRGRRCKRDLTGLFSELNPDTPPEVREQAIIDKILTIQYTAWPTCRGSHNVTINGESRTKSEDEAPDGWLDYDSCEARLLRGVGQCRRITT